MATHPYTPHDAIIPGYLPNELDLSEILSLFSGICCAIFAVTYAIAKWMQPSLRSAEMLTIMWFTLCAFLHLFFEGYFVTNFRTLGSKQTLFAQMWKEYALSDSRYLTQDQFVLCIETVTVLVMGPMCLLVTALTVLRHPLRFPMQTIASTIHLYSDVLYYTTAGFDHFIAGVSYSRPESYYFYVYFIGTNSPWIIIPLILIYHNTIHLTRAATVQQGLGANKKSL